MIQAARPVGRRRKDGAGESSNRSGGVLSRGAKVRDTKKGHAKRTGARRGLVEQTIAAAIDAQSGIAKADAAKLFQEVAAAASTPMGTVRAELIPDSSWKRAGKTLGPQASQTAARLAHILAFAGRVWGNAMGAAEWLMSPHPELRGATPFSMLKTEAGGRAVEALLGALEFGFPV